MSRLYGMSFNVLGFKPEFKDRIQSAAEEYWWFDIFDVNDDCVSGSGVETVGGGQTEEEFAEDFAHKIFGAVGPCQVIVWAQYLEDMGPDEDYQNAPTSEYQFDFPSKTEP